MNDYQKGFSEGFAEGYNQALMNFADKINPSGRKNTSINSKLSLLKLTNISSTLA